MARDFKKLCRLCAKKEQVLKDLNDENSKNILKMIQDFVQIAICENDGLPTKICLNCEEKIVSFQLFILECYKVQETLQNMYLNDCEKYTTDIEVSEYHIGTSDIKPEVKDEIITDVVIATIKSEDPYQGFDAEIYENDDIDFKSDSEDSITLASLREAKLNEPKKKEMTEEQKQEYERILLKADAKIRDFVAMKCEECCESFKVWGRLRLHYIRAHKKRPLAFCICGYAVRSKSALYRHVSEHKSNMPKLSKKINYVGNDLRASDLIKFICDKCDKEFSSWYKLKSHSEWLHKAAPTVRCRCGILLNSRTVMYKHIQDHRAPDVLHCDKCPKTAKTVDELEKHKLRHIPKSERNFQCSSCDKVFSSKDCLKSHERSHIPIEQRKIYHCDVCNLKFTTRSSATSHKRVVHEKIKSYVCDLCGYACGTNGELRQHRAIHSDDKPFECRKCSKAFKTYSNLKTHMDTHEETSYVCFVCSRVLNSRRTLRKHLLVHDDKCTHVCTYCNKAFKRRQTLKVHLSMHTGDKPLSCKWCDERFAYASTLRSHRLRAHPDKSAHYQAYGAHMTQEYLKNDAAPVNVAKSDV
ncbi:zinc finger protein 708-like [Colias croceus]|uniref:zinc finger protein 708-like n=1 Tax=Colias crocea TaxID=72248 RepID=UPI001E27B362|nr:zinc finger protein 708-like [Colias croceus]